MSSQNMYCMTFHSNKKAVVWLSVVLVYRQHVLCFYVLEGKMFCSCSRKAKEIQSCVTL